MSGHSKWSTIKRQKGASDVRRGQLFTKLANAIIVATREGGGGDPETNFRLRLAVEKARQANMPKVNIERAVTRGQGKGEAGNLEKITYEGFAPEGVAVLVEAATDNRQRTAQTVKNIFERAGGRLGGPGSVAYQFEPMGLLTLAKAPDVESQFLALIDLGVADVEETQDAIEVYTVPTQLAKMSEEIKKAAFKVLFAELVMRPKTTVKLDQADRAGKVLKLLDSLEQDEDIQKVYANLDVPDQVLSQIKI